MIRYFTEQTRTGKGERRMDVRCIWEHNGGDTLLYSTNLIGAYTRGPSKEIALEKMQEEARAYLRWANIPLPTEIVVKIVQEKDSELNIADADSDAIFEEETLPLSMEEYCELKMLVLKSAEDFLKLYAAMPNVDISHNPRRQTFYGKVPQTAREMYEHTKSVNSYYFEEIGIETDNERTIYECRKRGFELLEKTENFLNNTVIEGSYGEMWSLRKVMRRFIWHDRIHAKAMCRMALKAFGSLVCNPFMLAL